MKKLITDEMAISSYNTLRKYCYTTNCSKCVFGDKQMIKCTLTPGPGLNNGFYGVTVENNTQGTIKKNMRCKLC